MKSVLTTATTDGGKCQILLTIKGKQKRFTPEEARSIYDQLSRIFGSYLPQQIPSPTIYPPPIDTDIPMITVLYGVGVPSTTVYTKEST